MPRQLPTELIDLIASFIPAQRDIKRLPNKYNFIKDKQIFIRKAVNRHRYLQEDLLMKHRLFIYAMTKGQHMRGLYEDDHIEFPLKILRLKDCPITYGSYYLHIICTDDYNDEDLCVQWMRGDGECDEWTLIEMNYNKVLNHYSKQFRNNNMTFIKTIW